MTNDPDQLITAWEVARIFRVSERTVRRWSASGDLDDCLIRTPGGKFRYRLDRVRARVHGTQTSGSGVPLTTSAPDPDPTQEG